MTFLNNVTNSGVLSASSFNLFVSQFNGSDVTGNGTELNPYATIMAAITAAGTPVNLTNVIVMDNAVYPENVVISQNNVNLIGSFAYIQPVAGDGLAVTAAAATNYVNFNVIQAGAGGFSINYSGTVNLFVNATSVIGNFTSSNGTLTINTSGLLSGNGTTSGGGVINYVANSRSGTDGASVIGVSPTGSSATSLVVNDFTSNGINYPTVDGAPGDVITTDGAGNLSFAPGGGGGGITWSGIAGTTQAAAVNNGYVVQNVVLATVITLPDTAPLGSTVIVKGLGAPGWFLQAGAAQTILSPGVTTTVGGNLGSFNQYDSISVTAIVADTTWSLDWTTSAGLIPS